MTINDIVPIIKIGHGVDYHRLVNPLVQLGYDMEAHMTKTYDSIKDAKIVVFSRDIDTDNLTTILAAREKYGFKVVMDLDDYWHLYPKHMVYKNWVAAKMPEVLTMIMKLVDAVTVTTERLADMVRPINPNVYVIPNAVPIGEGQFNRITPVCPDDVVRFGYVGGSSHLHDLKTIQHVFVPTPQLPFTLAGYNNPNEDKGNIWYTMEQIASMNGHNKNYTRSETKDLNTYMGHYEKIDVAFAPLENNTFNKFKSSLKFYEAAVMKCAFVCADMAPFADDVPRDIAFFCSSVKEWKAAIKLLKNNPELVKERGEAAYQWVKENRNLETINKLRMEIYEEIYNGKDITSGDHNFDAESLRIITANAAA